MDLLCKQTAFSAGPSASLLQGNKEDLLLAPVLLGTSPHLQRYRGRSFDNEVLFINRQYIGCIANGRLTTLLTISHVCAQKKKKSRF